MPDDKDCCEYSWSDSMLANNKSNQTAYSIPLHKDMPQDVYSDMHGRLMTVIWHFGHLALTHS